MLLYIVDDDQSKNKLTPLYTKVCQNFFEIATFYGYFMLKKTLFCWFKMSKVKDFRKNDQKTRKTWKFSALKVLKAKFGNAP